MGAIEFLLMLVIAGIAGYIATQLMGARRMHILAVIALGFVGAIVGRYAAGFFNLPEPFPIMIGGSSFPLLWSIAGSALIVAIVSGINSN
jgi:uncharacterized membrane protein YeaQ/YmgE (transglycosylase-associated protein family)